MCCFQYTGSALLDRYDECKPVKLVSDSVIQLIILVFQPLLYSTLPAHKDGHVNNLVIQNPGGDLENISLCL